MLSGHRVNCRNMTQGFGYIFCWASTDKATQSLISACCGNMAGIAWCCTYLTASLQAQLIYTAIGWRCMCGEELQVCIQGCTPRLSQQLHISVLSEVGHVRGNLSAHSFDSGRAFVGESSLQDCTGLHPAKVCLDDGAAGGTLLSFPPRHATARKPVMPYRPA